MSRLSDKVVMVTGATSGIGTDIARRMAAEGARVGVCGRNVERGQEIAAEIGDAATFISLDVANEDSWASAVDAVVKEFGALSVLVNNAGIMTPASVENTTTELFQSIYMTNAGGVFYGCKQAIAKMKASGMPCSLVNVLSTTALKTSALDYGVWRKQSRSPQYHKINRPSLRRARI